MVMFHSYVNVYQRVYNVCMQIIVYYGETINYIIYIIDIYIYIKLYFPIIDFP